MESKSRHSGSTRERARWAVREGAVLLAILGFWVAVFLALSFLATLLLTPVRLLGLEVLFPAFRFVDGALNNLWAVLVPLVAANASLYVLVRVGTVLLDHYRD